MMICGATARDGTARCAMAEAAHPFHISLSCCSEEIVKAVSEIKAEATLMTEPDRQLFIGLERSETVI